MGREDQNDRTVCSLLLLVFDIPCDGVFLLRRRCFEWTNAGRRITSHLQFDSSHGRNHSQRQSISHAVVCAHWPLSVRLLPNALWFLGCAKF